MTFAIDGQTLGRSLAKIRLQLQLTDDIEALFENALKRRNTLIHRFYMSYGLNFLNEGGRDKMVAELLSISEKLNRARREAQRISELLVRAVHMFQQFHNGQLKA